MRLSVGDLVTLDREQYARPENYRIIVTRFLDSEEFLTRISNLDPPVVGIVVRSWTREVLRTQGNQTKIQVLTHVDVAWPDGHCTCPAEILFPLKNKRGSE